MFVLLLLLLGLAGCDEKPPWRWEPAAKHEDLLACNATRAGGNSVYASEMKFRDCMASLGYRRVWAR